MLVPSANKTLKGHKLLLLTPWPPPAAGLALLRDRFPGLAVEVRQQPWVATLARRDGEGDDEAAALWRDVTILVTGSTLPEVGQAPRLQVVQLLSAGAEHVLDNPLFDDEGIVLCTANGVHGPQISEWVISTYLALQHKIPTYLKQQREGRWKRLEEMPDDSVDKTVGILGYGSIGRQTARVATALGMSVHAYTLHPRPTPASRRSTAYTPPGLGDPDGVLPRRWFSGASAAELHAFLGSGLDLLVVATPLTPKTRGLISHAELAALGNGSGGRAILSNVGRGPIVDTDALIQALGAGGVGGAALDVTDPEPLPEGHVLWRSANVIVTPHTSGASTAYGKRIMGILELNLGRLSEGRELTNVVSRKDGY